MNDRRRIDLEEVKPVSRPVRRWIYVFGAFVLLVAIGSTLHRRVPGQEEQPSLAKAALCEAARSMHQGVLAAAREEAMIESFGVTGDRLFTIEVDAERWRTEPIESRELLAIAGWCQVAGEDGHGVALLIDSASRDEVGTVVDGEFIEPAN